jgi:transketolase
MDAGSDDIAKAYGEALVALGAADPSVVVVDTDIADSCQTEAFKKTFPDRSFDIGIAEQSMVTLGAGLALCGKIPICNSFAVFAVERGLDMIRQSVCYNKANVKIVGHSAGQTMGYTGPSHHTIEDIAALRALPGMAILSPSDAEETAQMVTAMARWRGPVYLRLPRAVVRKVHGPEYAFEFGKTDRLTSGHDVTIFAHGVAVEIALAAGEELLASGIAARVVNVPCLKPLPESAILDEGRDTVGAVVVEDHGVAGGLGSIVAEAYSRGLRKPVVRIGIPDTFTESDEYPALLKKYGVSVPAVIGGVKEVLEASGRAPAAR